MAEGVRLATLSPDAEIVVSRWFATRETATYSAADRYMARLLKHLLGKDHSREDGEFGAWDSTDDKALDLWVADDATFQKAKGKRAGLPRGARRIRGGYILHGRRYYFHGNQYVRVQTRPKIEEKWVVGSYRARGFDYTFRWRMSAKGMKPRTSAWVEPWEENPGGASMRARYTTTGSGKIGEKIVGTYFGRQFRSALDSVHVQGAFDMQLDHSDLGIEIRLVSNNIRQVRPKFNRAHVAAKTAAAKQLGIRQAYGFLHVDMKRAKARLYIAKKYPPPSSYRRSWKRDFHYIGEADLRGRFL